MAQAAPTGGGVHRPGRAPERRAAEERVRTPDVFDARVHALSRIIVPVGLGLIYGYWVSANSRSGGPITGWNLLLGFVSALVFAALSMTLLTLTPRLPKELHALLWTAFVGCAFGFAYSQTDKTMLRTVLMSLVVSAATFAALFYHYYTHRDAFGRRAR
ncbi:hypothetical protein NX794_32470 [Streptomyces sp. LP11]|uniref:Integral membrane protein n=1 Tax=Streptomyces pyxinicus TaxID=2970331 RepID=A0ABT2BBU0_9ACTN|nr:hypothetical protein [Streptomyces sp. LP11]MCS0605885.1 hypothetical protein [Streptomyces sp. LP11]